MQFMSPLEVYIQSLKMFHTYLQMIIKDNYNVVVSVDIFLNAINSGNRLLQLIGFQRDIDDITLFSLEEAINDHTSIQFQIDRECFSVDLLTIMHDNIYNVIEITILKFNKNNINNVENTNNVENSNNSENTNNVENNNNSGNIDNSKNKENINNIENEDNIEYDEWIPMPHLNLA